MYEYTINEGELHCLERDDIIKFLGQFVSGLQNQLMLDELIAYKDPFVVDSANNKLIKLSYKQNEKELLKELKMNMKFQSLEEVKKSDFLVNKEDLKENNIKNFFQKIFEKDIYEI